jgi:hypothetical protein
VRPLLGGLKAWEDAGFPLQEFFPAEEVKAAVEAKS